MKVFSSPQKISQVLILNSLNLILRFKVKVFGKIGNIWNILAKEKKWDKCIGDELIEPSCLISEGWFLIVDLESAILEINFHA